MIGSMDELARSVDAVVRDVAGVEEMYSARAAIVRAARRLIDDDEPLALVQRRGESLEVTVSVAVVAGGASASAVADAVADAVHLVVASADGSDSQPPLVRVRVSRVLVSAGGAPAASAIEGA